MYAILNAIHIIFALCLIGIILIQQGKGADMGTSFGSGSSNSLFGSSGAGNFLTKTTAILATVFFLVSILLGSLKTDSQKEQEIWSELNATTPTSQQAQSQGEEIIQENVLEKDETLDNLPK